MQEIPVFIEQFTNTDNFIIACLITFIFTWIVAIFVIIKARSLRINSKSIVPEYNPPEYLSPVFARYIMVSGREGGIRGEISKTGMQLLTLINLYEDGLFKKLKIKSGGTIEYEIHENFRNMECAEEEKKFLERMITEIGMSGNLQKSFNKKDSSDGYITLNSLWFSFWHTDLYHLALLRRYMEKEGKITPILSIFTASLIFGTFFGIFLSFIPVIGIFLAGILLLPVLVVFSIAYLLASVISPYLYDVYTTFSNLNFIVSNIQTIKTAFVGFAMFSWFAWAVIFNQNLSKLTRKLTPTGLEIVRKLNGYKMYLKSVDRDRLSFSFNKESDLSRNRTSFSWLGVFGMIKDKHWDEWYLISGSEQKKHHNLAI